MIRDSFPQASKFGLEIGQVGFLSKSKIEKSSLSLDRLTKSSLSSQDSQEAYGLAERYLLEIGMNEQKFLISGNRGAVSKRLMDEIESEKEGLINQSFEYVLGFVKANAEKIKFLKQRLSEQEVLTGREIEKLLKTQ